MRDNFIHSLKQPSSANPQTYCGIVPFGHKVSSDRKLISCPLCQKGWEKDHPKYVQPVETHVPVQSEQTDRSSKSSRRGRATTARHRTSGTHSG